MIIINIFWVIHRLKNRVSVFFNMTDNKIMQSNAHTFFLLFFAMNKMTARHKTNANYENFLKNAVFTHFFTISWYQLIKNYFFLFFTSAKISWHQLTSADISWLCISGLKVGDFFKNTLRLYCPYLGRRSKNQNFIFKIQ